MNFAPALRPPFTPKETMEPQPLGISFLPSAWSGWSGRSGCSTQETAFSPSRMSSTFRVLAMRSEEHTSELQSLMRISYAVFCLKKTKKQRDTALRVSRAQPHKPDTTQFIKEDKTSTPMKLKNTKHR